MPGLVGPAGARDRHQEENCGDLQQTEIRVHRVNLDLDSVKVCRSPVGVTLGGVRQAFLLAEQTRMSTQGKRPQEDTAMLRDRFRPRLPRYPVPPMVSTAFDQGEPRTQAHSWNRR